MYSFDGDYRRRPIQNLGGASQCNDRETIIRKAQLERQKRNDLRRQDNGAVVLQSYTRSFIHRQRKKKLERENFDNFVKVNKGKLDTDDNLIFCLRRILFFYSKDNPRDCERLIEICQLMIKAPGRILKNAVMESLWLHRIKKLLICCLEQMTVPNSPPAIPMRTIETYTSESVIGKHIKQPEKIQTYLEAIFQFLISRHYFRLIRCVLESKFPPLDGVTLNPPNPAAEATFQMIAGPLTLTHSGFSYGPEICKSFAKHMLSPPLSEPIRYFVLPYFSKLEIFPFKELIDCLLSEIECENQMDIDGKDFSLKSEIFTSYLLNSILLLDNNAASLFKKNTILYGYIRIISEISSNILNLPKSYCVSRNEDDQNSSDSESEEQESPGMPVIERECLIEAVALLNDPKRVHFIVDNVEMFLDNADLLYHLCKICHNLSIYNKSAVFDYRLLYTLAFMPKFIRAVWFTLANQSSRRGFSSPLNLISKGLNPKEGVDLNTTIPFLATFCALFSRLVPTLHDGEFCQENIVLEGRSSNSLMPFSIDEILQMSKTLRDVSMGLVELAFPETRSNLNEHYRSVLGRSNSQDEKSKHIKQVWSNLLKVVVSVLNQIHTRDLRRGFCPEDHWTIKTLNLPLDRPSDLPLARGSRRGIRPFQPIRDFTREDFENGPPMSTKQIRSITVLREIPFVVPFSSRVNILQGLVAADKIRVQGDLQGFLQGPQIQIVVRRTHLYEDAYDKLRPENEPDLRHRFRVQFVSSFGLEEAGIDGGGVFREFLSELIKTAFDPNRGFFMVTTDNKLYPNPSVADLITDFEKHYYFMGRILGKAIYENLLVELPLAEFFLSKLAGKYSDVDVHQLASLDPELYRNLLSLKAYEGDVSELGLDFTVVTNDLGKTKVKDLKPNGQLILVTNLNRIEYIQLMADYKLNKQIRQHCVAFRKGLSNVLPVEWLYMFSNKELQILISGAEIPIDLTDLRTNCKYGGEYSPSHPTIECFWKVLEGFTDLQRRQLLKFVTSCSRPPLLGFKDLDPPFYIQNAGDEERLPTASTCTNLLKLPAFKTIEQMREKLLYAIQAGAGFDLS